MFHVSSCQASKTAFRSHCARALTGRYSATYEACERLSEAFCPNIQPASLAARWRMISVYRYVDGRCASRISWNAWARGPVGYQPTTVTLGEKCRLRAARGSGITATNRALRLTGLTTYLYQVIGFKLKAKAWLLSHVIVKTVVQ